MQPNQLRTRHREGKMKIIDEAGEFAWGNRRCCRSRSAGVDSGTGTDHLRLPSRIGPVRGTG